MGCIDIVQPLFYSSSDFISEEYLILHSAIESKITKKEKNLKLFWNPAKKS